MRTRLTVRNKCHSHKHYSQKNKGPGSSESYIELPLRRKTDWCPPRSFGREAVALQAALPLNAPAQAARVSERFLFCAFSVGTQAQATGSSCCKVAPLLSLCPCIRTPRCSVWRGGRTDRGPVPRGPVLRGVRTATRGMSALRNSTPASRVHRSVASLRRTLSHPLNTRCDAGSLRNRSRQCHDD